jgi:hypothetical protein
MAYAASHYAIDTSGRLDQISSTIATSTSDSKAAFTTLKADVLDTTSKISNSADKSASQHAVTLAKIDTAVDAAANHHAVTLAKLDSAVASSSSQHATTLARIESVVDHSTTQHQITQVTLAKIEHVLQKARDSEIKAKYELERSCWLVPYPKNERFYGRDELLRRMESSLVSSFTTTRPQFCSFALYGLPGVGKSHTALEFVYRYQSHFRAVFWIFAASVEKIIQGCCDIAGSLGFPNSTLSGNHTQVIGDVMDWLRHTSTFSRLCYSFNGSFIGQRS